MMTTPVREHQITAHLTDEEYQRLQSFAAAQGLDLENAIPTLIHDQLWDAQFAASHDLLREMADEAHQEYLTGTLQDVSTL
ncbi:MAG: hypothetical protein LCI00_16135 [Chloroflexi bacterium]|nr:hypothetical protein [Chloroflexota bacterium]MCC6892761.1 hypothetical protein [Anaerolineae bacterium]